MIKENDIVLCTVNRIQKTTVFLDIENNGQGTMIFAEVSPGRIRNIREYVVPGKKIVCKVLRIRNGNIELSLRRVAASERDLIMENHKREKMLLSMLKPIIKEPEKVLEKIKASYQATEFIDEVRENPKIIEKFLKKTEAEKLSKILQEKKEKDKEVMKTIIIKSQDFDGIKKIKEILDIPEATTRYKGSSQFTIKVIAKDYKTANQIMDKILKEIEDKSKKLRVQLEIKEK
ncbi:hypothetical protein COU62_04425 [Candidatus Pacearchaeota archaeon CG10_big_fil_rev_8_21_14_0_10_35_219]|nr:hypothetical protein [Candidatus Pacearchaeota archaeon]OIO42088.1 MAG: hypothetical protein AUJ63_04045 [Candidatus Pacearchaeota archaeon CG1_02_35_32]PIO07238.1 MAG: hypothetical protein COU62_04425 [Candidatus Pacearchaeota archaeon CG10_big_fil_rev_8_21_14_0_10_35_219]PIY81193.1 MAG: hypothetical protein COY79_04085 [Candidatus Pacearchaeota archaeon CG_4_10_14_0_8_um_filter_35_169]PIZ79444.1 MAG: hypothetical protein COY00_04095 [Candidatus Pacearchaeota archaeon CG_4_10_14_0_2_um_filt